MLSYYYLENVEIIDTRENKQAARMNIVTRTRFVSLRQNIPILPILFVSFWFWIWWFIARFVDLLKTYKHLEVTHILHICNITFRDGKKQSRRQ
jgi:hypothetical protein